MKSFGKKILTCILLFASAICLVLAGCSSKEVKLRFETNGGDPIEEIVATVGDEVSLPTPEREGYSFEGWYENADFSGNAVTSVVAESSKTFYAKWEQMYEIKLELGGGQLSASNSKVYAKEGQTIADVVKDLVPTRTGWQFGEWQMNGAALSPSAKMPKSEITLTARYKVGYTVHVWLQNAADGFERGEDIVGYDYPAANYTPDVTVKGYEITEHEGEMKSGPLSEDPASNVFTFYFERGHYQLTLLSNYPVGMEDEIVTIDFTYGDEIVLPYESFRAEGYLLTGWSRSVVDTVDYPSQVIDGLLRNGDGVKREDKVSLDEDTTLYAIWERGFTDLFGGEDVIYHLQGETDRLILERYGSYYSGEYVPATGTFYFYDKTDSISLQGKFFGNGFAYYNEARDGQVYYRYVVGGGVYTDETVSLDAYNGIRYTLKGSSSMLGPSSPDQISEGTYYIDEKDFYHATFTEGVKAGSELTMVFGSVTVNGAPMRVFMAREDEDVARGQMYFCGIMENGEMGAVPSAYLLELDGFGSAVMDMGTSETDYLYVTGADDTFALYTMSGYLYGTFKFIREGYILYDNALDITVSDADGNTLELDGACNAVVTVDGVSKSGYFTAEESAFGGYIVSVFLGDGKHVYLTTTQTDENNEERTVFEEKDTSYAEYYYRSNEGRTYYSPLIVIDNEKECKASVYGYTQNREFLKVAEGAYTYSKETGYYQFTVGAPIPLEEEVISDPIDVTRLESFVFSLGVASNRNVSYWHSFTYRGGKPTNYDEKYTSEKDDEGELILVGGFAVYSAKDAERVEGLYSELSGYKGVIRVQNGSAYLYFELNSEDKTFVVLEKRIGTLRERLASGETDSSATLSFDGKGGATLTVTAEGEEPKVTEGAYSEAGETAFGTPVLHFTPKEGEDGFDFVVLSTSSASYFTRLNAMEKELTSEEDGELELDGFSHMARYTDADDNVFEGSYTVPEKDVILFTDEDGTVAYYFDVKEGGVFTRRGPEAATYLLVENQYISGVALRFDGYGEVTVLRLAESDEEKDEPIGSGKYSKDGDLWSVTYEDEEGSKVELKGILELYLVTETAGYLEFVVEQKEISRVYINEEDWSVLVPDGHGHAELRNKYGRAESGYYAIISEDLLYYMNSAQTDACIYRYNAETGSIEKLDYSEHGYYTSDLRSLLFSRYGFMIMDGETQYYYTVDDSDEVTVYLCDPEDEAANEYGYVAEEIGKFEDTIEFKGATYINNNGFPIRFEREKSTEDDYPVPYDEDEEGNEIKKPLRLLTFQPTGSAEFSVTGTVAFEEDEGLSQAYQCTVVRELVSGEGEEEEYVLYIQVYGYRFDIEVTYSGEEGSVYSVVGMHYIQSAFSNFYFDLYYMFAMFGYSGTLENVYGEITVVQEFNEKGEQTDQHLDVDLGSQHDIRLLDGTAITKLENADYELDEESMLYVVTQEHEGYTYKFYFGFSVNAYVGVVAYDLVACTRVQKLTSGDYTVEIERLLATDLGGSIGSPYTVSLKQGETEIDIETVLLLTDKTYCVSRTREHLASDADGVNSGKILSTTYYELVLTDKNPEQVGGDGKGEGDAESGEVGGEESEDDEEEEAVIVPLYASVTVTTHSAKHYGDSYNNVDIFEEDNRVAAFTRGGTLLFANSSTYDKESNTYTVTATNKHRYTIKLEENGGETYVTVTQLQDAEEEEDEQGEEN